MSEKLIKISITAGFWIDHQGHIVGHTFRFKSHRYGPVLGDVTSQKIKSLADDLAREVFNLESMRAPS